MADVTELQNRFAIPGVLEFEKTASGLVVARVTAPAAQATIYLQGAHVTHWKPAGEAPAIFLSQRAEFVAGKPIRGGVPRSEEHTSELQSLRHLVCRLLL